MHWHPYRNTPTEQHKYLWINELRQRVKKNKKGKFFHSQKDKRRGKRKNYKHSEERSGREINKYCT
jgi:hypothetical protein